MNRAVALAALMLAGFSGSAACAEEDPALRAVDECRAKLDPRTDIGIERVRRRCPELLPALESAPWRDLLPATLGERREDISAGSLRALADLVRHASDEGEGRLAPDREALAPVLAKLGDQGKQGATRWQRFTNWLKQKVSDRGKEVEAGWLDNLARQLRTSEGVAEALTYLGYAMVVGLVLFVVGSELRAAGLFGGARRSGRRASPAAEWRRRLMLIDVMDAPLADRPGMLLRLLGEALSRARRLPASDGLTAGELVRRAQLDDEAQRVELARVAATAERVRYAAQAPGDAKLEEAVDTARELLGKFARLPGVRR